MDIFDTLIQIRKEKKVRQEALSGHLGVTATTLSRYESKQRTIPYDLLIAYAEHLGYEVRILKKLT